MDKKEKAMLTLAFCTTFLCSFFLVWASVVIVAILVGALI